MRRPLWNIFTHNLSQSCQVPGFRGRIKYVNITCQIVLKIFVRAVKSEYLLLFQISEKDNFDNVHHFKIVYVNLKS